jgi:hypothetical protein
MRALLAASYAKFSPSERRRNPGCSLDSFPRIRERRRPGIDRAPARSRGDGPHWSLEHLRPPSRHSIDSLLSGLPVMTVSNQRLPDRSGRGPAGGGSSSRKATAAARRPWWAVYNPAIYLLRSRLIPRPCSGDRGAFESVASRRSLGWAGDVLAPRRTKNSGLLRVPLSTAMPYGGLIPFCTARVMNVFPSTGWMPTSNCGIGMTLDVSHAPIRSR